MELPFKQRTDPLTVRLDGAEGNVLIVGGPLSGKTTLLQSLVAGIAMQNSPEQVQILGIDLGDGGLSALAGLPQVSAIARRSEPDLVRRVVGEAARVVLRRQEKRDSANPDSTASQSPDNAVLAIDDWGLFRTAFEDLATTVSALAQVGPGGGLHVAITASGWSEVPQMLQEFMGTKLELRLGAAKESEISRRAASNVPFGSPGRGIVAGPSHFLAAVPRADGRESSADLAAATRALVEGVAAAHSGMRVRRIRTLPRMVPADELRRDHAATFPEVLIGVDEAELAPVAYDFSRHQHMLIYGDSGSGKTALLRLMVADLRLRKLRQAQVVLIERRGSLTDISQAKRAVAMIAARREFVVEESFFGAPGKKGEAAAGTDWPALFIVVDDYDVVAKAAGDPLKALVAELPLAVEVGLHLVIAQSTKGARGDHADLLVRKLRELDVGGVILSGDPGEGPLIEGIGAGSQPPGRGTLVHPGQAPRVIQVAWEPPSTMPRPRLEPQPEPPK
ncbi:FtsK/SpoIIIE domain-containing protein [Catenulispora yoronensis]